MQCYVANVQACNCRFDLDFETHGGECWCIGIIVYFYSTIFSSHNKVKHFLSRILLLCSFFIKIAAFNYRNGSTISTLHLDGFKLPNESCFISHEFDYTNSSISETKAYYWRVPFGNFIWHGDGINRWIKFVIIKHFITSVTQNPYLFVSTS